MNLGTVKLVSGQLQTGTAGETISSGDCVCIYQGVVVKAIASDNTKAVAVGICVANTIEGMKCIYAGSNSVVASETAENNSQTSIWYVDSTTAGGISSFDDLAIESPICAVCSAGTQKQFFKVQVKSFAETKDSTYTEDVLKFETDNLAYEDGNLREIIDYNMPSFGGCRDGIFVINASIWSDDGVNWQPCPTDGPSQVTGWTMMVYILKGMVDGSPVYMDTRGQNSSSNMKRWDKINSLQGYTAYMGSIWSEPFFWKNEYQCVGVDDGITGPDADPFQYIWNKETNEWEGHYLKHNVLIPQDKYIKNIDNMKRGDSKPDGTCVRMLARNSQVDYEPRNNIHDGNWTAVELVDNGGNGEDSFEPIAALASEVDSLICIRYNEQDDYWLAATDSKVYKNESGSDEWVAYDLPITKPWSYFCFDGKHWVSVSTVANERMYIYSTDGENWKVGADIDPCWDLGAGEVGNGIYGQLNMFTSFGTVGITLFGFKPKDLNENNGIEYYRTV